MKLGYNQATCYSSYLHDLYNTKGAKRPLPSHSLEAYSHLSPSFEKQHLNSSCNFDNTQILSNKTRMFAGVMAHTFISCTLSH